MLARQTPLKKLAEGVPLVVWLLGLGSFINVGGLSLLWPINSIYIHNVLGKPLTVAGLVLAVYSGAGFIGSFLGGWLYDRLGAVKVLVVGLMFSAAFICIPVFFHGWWTYVAVMAAFGTTCAMPFPAMNALAGHAWPEGGRRAFNFLYVANNLGVAAGTALGGVLAGWSFQAVFVGIASAYMIFVLLVLTLYRRHFRSAGKRESAKQSRVDRVYDAPTPWVPLCTLYLGFALCWVVYVQWQSTISVYMHDLGFSLSAYSGLWTLNGLLIFAAQPVVSRVVRLVPSLTVHKLAGVLLFMCAYVVLLVSNHFAAFVVAMVVMTSGELLAWPAVPALVAQLSPEHRLGLLQGLVASSATFGRMLGPVVGGYLFDHTTTNILLVSIAAMGVLPFASFWITGRLVKRPFMHGRHELTM